MLVTHQKLPYYTFADALATLEIAGTLLYPLALTLQLPICNLFCKFVGHRFRFVHSCDGKGRTATIIDADPRVEKISLYCSHFIVLLCTKYLF